jgi:glutathione S-transferase
LANPYRLYGWSGSGSVAVQAALEECGAPYQRIWVSKEPAAIAEYRKINPMGRVPALALPDGTVMFESAAMLIHLAGAYPEARLAPQAGTSRHAQFLQWMVFLSANVYETALRLYYSDRYSTGGAAAAAGIREKATADYLAHLELIAGSLGPYVLGDHYSAADLYLYMLASWAPGEQSALHARIPALGMHAARLSARPAVVKVEADHATG